MVIYFGPKNLNHQYFLNSSTLKSAEVFKDLGILVDKNLNFHENLKFVTTKSFKLINMIFRIFHCNKPELYLKLYKIYILPIIFYCFNTYFTNTRTFMNSIEKIQRYFTKRLYIRTHPNSPIPHSNERLKVFELIPLESSYVRMDVLMLYKILTNRALMFNFHPHLVYTNLLELFCNLSSKLFHNSFYHRSLVFWKKYLSPHDIPLNDYQALRSFLYHNHSRFVMAAS